MAILTIITLIIEKIFPKILAVLTGASMATGISIPTIEKATQTTKNTSIT